MLSRKYINMNIIKIYNFVINNKDFISDDIIYSSVNG